MMKFWISFGKIVEWSGRNTISRPDFGFHSVTTQDFFCFFVLNSLLIHLCGDNNLTIVCFQPFSAQPNQIRNIITIVLSDSNKQTHCFMYSNNNIGLFGRLQLFIDFVRVIMRLCRPLCVLVPI